MKLQRFLPGVIGLTLAVVILTTCGAPAEAPVPSTLTPARMPSTAQPSPALPTLTMTPVHSSQFPIGLFDCVECQGMTERYSDDGTLVVYLRGAQYITGKWGVEGDTFYTGDSFCGDEDAMPASYKWRFDGEILTFQVTQDECLDRRNSLDGRPWRMIQNDAVVLTFDGKACRYQGPEIIAEGDLTVTLINNTDLDAAWWIHRLEEGKTWQDMLDYIGPPGSNVHPPPWASGGIITAPVPDTANARVYSLKKGLYAISCCTCYELSGPRGVWPGASLEVRGE